MVNKTNRKKKFIAGTIGALTALTVAGVTVYNTTQDAYAKATLSGVEKIIQDNSNENPFIILEILPDKADASLGYFISGEEPVDATAKSIKDMPSQMERAQRFSNQTAEDKINALGIDGAVSYTSYQETDDGDTHVDIRGNFAEVGPEKGEYTLADSTVIYPKITIVEDGSEDHTNWKYTLGEINAGISLYRKYTSYYVEDGGTYTIGLSKLPADDSVQMPIVLNSAEGVYNHQYFAIDGEVIAGNTLKDLVDSKTLDGSQLLFEYTDADSPLTYAGTAEYILTQWTNNFVDIAAVTTQYVKVKEADAVDIGKEYYYITSVTEDASKGVFVARDSYGEVERPAGGFDDSYLHQTYYMKTDNDLPYSYDPANGTYAFTADYTREVYDSVTYNGGFKNEEWFKKSVFNLEDSELEDMYIDVIPVTMSELTQELLDKADLLYFVDSEDKGFNVANMTDENWLVKFDFDDEVRGFTDGHAIASKMGGATIEAVEGAKGKALRLDGVDDYLDVKALDGSSLLTGCEKLTVSFRIKPGEGSTNWAFYAAPDENEPIYQHERYIGILGNVGHKKAERYNNNGARPTSAEVYEGNSEWQYVTVVFTPTESIIYLNGVEKVRQASDYSLSGILGLESIFRIGRANWAGGEFFNGYLDDYVIANYAMEPDEVQNLINDQKWIANFDFDDETDGFKDAEAIATPNGGFIPTLEVHEDGKALRLNGSSEFLNVTDENGNRLLTGFTEMTVAFYMKPDNAGANWMFYAAPENIAEQGYLAERYIGVLENTGVITAERYNNNGSRAPSAGAGSPTDDWYHVAVVYTNTQMILYVNGQEAARVDSVHTLPDILGDNSIYQIGKANWTANGEYYQGLIDDYTIANYAMSEDEIRGLAGVRDITATELLCKSIIKKVDDGTPIALNRSMLTNAKNAMMFRKMAACLMHEDIMDPFGEVGIDNSNMMLLSLDTLKSTMKQPFTDGTHTFVNNNIFIYDDDKGHDVVSSNFDAEIYNQDLINYGFNEVLSEIDNENFYLEVAGSEQRIEERVTMATSIRHIINFSDRRTTVKTSLRVLDLEPYDFEDYYPGGEEYEVGQYTVYEDIKIADREDGITVNSIETDSICITKEGTLDKKQWIIENLAPQFAQSQEALDVTIMGTKEYIGKLDDLNANYDLIYIGMDTSIMNTEVVTLPDGTLNKTNNTIYHDTSMNGLVYSHVGDLRTVSTSSDQDAQMHGSFRLSGNDITSDKLRELKEYIEAGYAVIISDGFLIEGENGLQVNTQKVDPSSNMYKLINDTVLVKNNGEYRYYGKNVNSKSNFEVTNTSYASVRSNFSRYLGISKLTLRYETSDLPVAYNQEDGTQRYLSADSDGVYRLHFNMELENDAAVDLSSTTYDCQLYVDVDADGRYEEDELLTGLSITENGREKLPDASGRYHLETGNVYHISREVPEGYTGFLAWKLAFTQNDRTYADSAETAVVRSAVTGFSAVPNIGVKPTIKILQITTWDGYTNLDLDGNDMHALYNNVQDFTIDVTKITSAEYIGKATFSDLSYIEYLNSFDMVVLGFCDVFVFGFDANGVMYDSNMITEAILAIREYTLAGRSIMFTHDLNSMVIDEDATRLYSGAYANRLLRDVQGMDRFGKVMNSGLIPEEEKYEYTSLYDVAQLNNSTSNVDIMSLTNPILVSKEYKYNITREALGENARRASWDYHIFWNYHKNDSGWGADWPANFNSYVAQVNAGQITEYPYKINETFETTLTHPQYFQLNLDTDSRDVYDNDDVVVWYTLSRIPGWKDGFFNANDRDVRNNYFIYNKGNVTYTGSGDRTVTSDMEKKLFVNTLVASYRSGLHAPRAIYKESEWETSASITSMYLPYDPQLNDNSGGFLEEELEVHFYTTDMNLQRTLEQLNAKYYIESTSADYDLYTGGTYYKEVTPKNATRVVESGGTLTHEDENAASLTNNSMHTVTFTYDSIGLGQTEDIRDKYSTNIYLRLSHDELLNSRMGPEVALSATESMNKLNVVCTQLFELR